MSYNFKVVVKDGQFEGGSATSCPDGSFTISGHVNNDGSNESVGIQRFTSIISGDTSHSQQVASAQSWHK